MSNDKPVDPKPKGLHDDRSELWYVCTGIVNSRETGDDLKQMALGIREQLRLEARVNELTELLYQVKAERDKFINDAARQTYETNAESGEIMTPYHHTSHPVRRIDGRMIVADENEWRRLYSLEMLAAESNEPCRVLIGPEVFWDWDGAIYATDGEVDYVDADETGESQRYTTIADVRARLFRLIDQCPHVTFCIETDRPDDIYRKLPVRWYQGELTPVMTPPPNFWLGVGRDRSGSTIDGREWRQVPQSSRSFDKCPTVATVSI